MMNHYQDLYSTPVQNHDDYGDSRLSSDKNPNANAALSPPPLAPRVTKHGIRNLVQEPLPFVDYLMMPDLDESTNDCATLDSHCSFDSTESIQIRLRPRTLSPPSSPTSILTMLEDQEDYDTFPIMARPIGRYQYDPCPSMPRIETSPQTHHGTCSSHRISYNYMGHITAGTSSPTSTTTLASSWMIVKPRQVNSSCHGGDSPPGH